MPRIQLEFQVEFQREFQRANQPASQTLYYELHGRPDAPPVLLMHGWMQTGRSMLALANALAGGGYRVILPDMPGYGRSTPPNRSFAPDFYARDAACMAGFLRTLGVTPAHVAGFSDGGETALLMAVDHPDVCRSVTAWGAIGAYPPALGAWVRDAMPRLAVSASHRAQHPGQPVETWPEAWIVAFLEIVARGGDLSLSRAHRIVSPLLLMVGEHDPLNPVESARTFVRQAGTRAVFELFPEAGHALHEERPDLFLRHMLAFLERA